MADVLFAVVPFLSPTSTGTLDVVADGSGGLKNLGGVTPKAVIIIGGGSTDSDVTETPGVKRTVGFAVNGGNQNVSSYSSNDAVGFSQATRQYRTDRVIRSPAGVVASVDSWIANGVRLNFDVVDAVARRFFAIIIAGDDVVAFTDSVSAPTGTNQLQDITAPGFTPDLVLFHTCWSLAGSGNNANNAEGCFGAASRFTAENKAVSFQEPNSNTNSAHSMALYGSACLVRHGSAVDITAVAQDFDSNGFSLQYTGTSTNDGVIFYLALQLQASDVELLNLAHATATGVAAYSGAGVEPKFVMAAGATLLAYDSIHQNDAQASSNSISAFDGSQSRTHSHRSQFSVGTMDNGEQTFNAALGVGNNVDPEATRASFVSLDSDGFTVDYTAADSAATLGWAILVGDTAIPAAPVRATQAARMSLVEYQSNERITQVARLTLLEKIANPRVTQVARLTLCDYAPCFTRRAHLWRITRKDGVQKAFTSHDEPIQFGQLVYTPCGSLAPMATEQNADIEGIGNTEVLGIITDDGIKEDEVLAGLYDDAYLEIFMVGWGETDDPFISVDYVRRLMAGWLGNLSTGPRGFRAEVMGPGAKLTQKSFLETFAVSCRFEFGDPNTCGVDIDARKLAASVILAPDTGQLSVSVTLTTTTSKFENGFVEFTSGRNAGTRCEIKSIEFLPGDTAEIVLWAPAPFLPAAADTLDIFPGCDRSTTDCIFYDNILNHGGFPDVPGNDAISQTPDTKI